MIAEITLTGWPLVTVIGICAVCFVSLWIGWPWEGLIQFHKHFHCKKCENCEEE